MGAPRIVPNPAPTPASVSSFVEFSNSNSSETYVPTTRRR